MVPECWWGNWWTRTTWTQWCPSSQCTRHSRCSPEPTVVVEFTSSPPLQSNSVSSNHLKSTKMKMIEFTVSLHNIVYFSFTFVQLQIKIAHLFIECYDWSTSKPINLHVNLKCWSVFLIAKITFLVGKEMPI